MDCRNLPNNGWIDMLVFVPNEIPNYLDIAPRNFRMPLLVVFGDVPGCFRYNLDRPFNAKKKELIVEQSLKISSPNRCSDHPDALENILKPGKACANHH